jgi:diaminohydroxyphosphoribosylaminopyrimidine deaminase/5-amino-6-(5-phosphoribosylamino)uracil reductase
MHSSHKYYMQTALDLAKKGWPIVAPNPMVGCVIVKDDKIVAEGYHKKYGEVHAEVYAVNNLPGEIEPKDCTLYVNLEPCSHHGKTPPCADLIIGKGFKKVVIANSDPNPLVSGRGIEKLKNAGIEVVSGVLEQEGLELNKRFFTFHTKHRPYFILKWAQTADAFISRFPVPVNREENMIGNESQQKAVHQMRSEEMAIMVGKNTVLCDNPSLTARLVKGRNPIRIFIDKNLEVPDYFNIYNQEAQTIVFNGIKEAVMENIKWIKIDFSENVLEQIAKKLFELKIQSVLVEGGAFLLNDFIRQKLYDEAIVYVNDQLYFKSGVKAPVINGKGC